MKKRMLLLSGVVCLAGCLETREDLQAQEERKVFQSQVTSIQKSSADQVARYQELEEQMRNLNGKVEALEAQLGALSTRVQTADEANQKTQTEAQERLRLLTEAVSDIHNKVEALIAQAQAEQQAKAEAEAKAQQEAKAQEEAKAKEEKAKDEGSKEKPKKEDPLGSANHEFDAKNWKKAIVVYEKYRSANPKGKQYAEATYKIGVSFQELGMKQEARAFYEEVVAKYPKSGEAKKAHSRLNKLK